VHAVLDDIEDSAMAQSNNRGAAGEGLDARYSEVFHTRLEQTTGPAVELAQLGDVDVAEQAGPLAAQSRQTVVLGAGADDPELDAGPLTGLDRELQALGVKYSVSTGGCRTAAERP
jgi:hypothetical protein